MPRQRKYNSDEERRIAQRGYAKKYLDKFEEIRIRVPEGKLDYYMRIVEAVGLSLNKFAITAMDEKIERDGITPVAERTRKTSKKSDG